jgi:hypothetical protein
MPREAGAIMTKKTKGAASESTVAIPDLKPWEDKISGSYQKGVLAWLETGRLLLEAKGKLGHSPLSTHGDVGKSAIR